MKKKILLMLMFVVSASFITSLTAPQPTYADGGCDKRFLTIPAWYRGLANGPGCEIKLESAGNDPDMGGSLGPAILLISLNVTEMLMHIAFYASIIFLMYGGFKFMINADSPDAATKARKTIINAVIGLIISMMAIGIINLVFNSVTAGSLSAG